MKKVFLIILIATGLTSFDRRQSLNEGDHYLSPEHICVNDALGEGYVSLSTAKAIAVVDLKAGRLKETINLSFNPGDIQLSQDQKMVYLSDPSQAGSGSAISLAKSAGNCAQQGWSPAVCSQPLFQYLISH